MVGLTLVFRNKMGIININSPFDHSQKVHQLPTQTKPYNTLPPWNGGIAGRPDIRADLSIYPSRFISWGYRGEIFFKFDMGESQKRFIVVDGGKKTMVCRRRHVLRN